ncbi:hypothetical protein D3P09_22875 [Paenibacillus pinisoli]|uniref:Permease n=1 Tax=Paenibacillus pinisoli TaxID=1276110 RepID=A0A3A6PEK4_9BACL|nr:hypothetical protein [Paenibacillus pinisoli]RJX37208.1 hypothetical protein D3P09_22875 [Paenibacillus pinisoli]
MARSIWVAAQKIVVFSLAAVFIAQQLTSMELLLYPLGGLALLAIVLSLPRLKGIAKWLAAGFMAGGVVLMLLQKADLHLWFEAAAINATLVTLFVFAPLFGIPVRLPAYVAALRRFYETSVRSKAVMFTGTQLLTQIMGAFINVGSIPVVYHLAFVKPHSSRMARLLAAAMNRGFGGAIMWSPYFAAMALVTSALSLGWSSILPYIIGLSLLSLIASIAVSGRELWRKEQNDADSERAEDAGQAPEGSQSIRTPFPFGLAAYLVLAIAAILLLERLLELPMVLITCLGAVLIPLLWCAAKGAMDIYRQGIANHITVTLPALQKEITLFLTAGFFSGSIRSTSFGAYIPGLLEKLPVPLWLAFSLFTVLLIMATSWIGLHPIVPVTILATGIDPSAVGISTVYFAVLLLGSWGLSNPISPASAVNHLLAGLQNKTAIQMARPNYAYALWMAAALILYLGLLHYGIGG